ncbi:FtsB family cell division protein [Desulforamulus hydrothermalis]|uniref:Septum formation initiator n=1 Tax=Desulforamulus hydrothermalis Lam5 = DSM 18033 TaxID=1121428 RepID=K8EAI0_9FIRM|nr:septum formation initiator family protein [Desulforamulus hydrothermalis]CCO08633.1 Septum formation initiator [Desulforamulus hydrothermalis Lam5 = DSM 18033]SHH00684.1 cell division protein DivIC [Desulforamulus hydrothermalis Lam5 = DSM 18033]
MISTGKGKITELKLYREQPATNEPMRRRSKRGGAALMVSILFVAYMIFSLGSQFKKLHDMQNSMELLQNQVQELKTRNAALREEIKLIKSDSYVEQVAREQLGLVKPGETLVVQVQSPQPADAKTSSRSTGEKQQGEGFNIKYKNIYD